ncbi:MAG: phenylacetate--CoA ligase family protein [Lutibacter sp.]|nr:phenylacetate--CoA ligase family protein [Lutibacter sp.]MDP3946089.1 phenylacetate--CoA ligase family protein [Lutibacter sp.]
MYKIGERLRNPSIALWLSFLKTSETWTLASLEAYQLKKLQELVAVAYANSNYYKKSFDALGMKPADIQSLEDLKKLPIITKSDLLAHNKDIHTNLKFKKHFQANTSGTSGESLKFKREESADSFNRASIYRGYSWYNVNPWELNGYFWGYNFSEMAMLKIRILDSLQNRFRIFNYRKESIDFFIKKLKKAKYLHGYSSIVYETAKIINTQNLDKPINLKMVKGTSEKIFESYQEEIQKAFGRRMISEYGAAETGIIAFECPKGNMHLNMEGVIVEEIDLEIVVTNLQMRAFPIIRYQLGDYIKLAPKKETCECGMKHAIIEEVTGRIGQTVYGKHHTYPSLYFYYIFKNLALKLSLLLSYQVVQNEKGKLNFLIEQHLDSSQLLHLENEIAVYFKEDMEFTIEHSQNITAQHKKLKSFISNIA